MAPEGGDLPKMVTAEENEWITIVVDLDSVQKEKNGGPDEEWSCYRFNGVIDGEDVEDEEVPFWAMKAFWDLVGQEYQRGSEMVEIDYQRVKRGNKNTARFR